VNRGTDNYPCRGCTTYNKSFSPAWASGRINQTLPEKFLAGGSGVIENFFTVKNAGLIPHAGNAGRVLC
jgi:hypothetical protein